LKDRYAWSIGVLVTALFAFFFVYPAATIVGEAFSQKSGGWTWDYLWAVISDPVYVEGLINALALGVVSTMATLALAFPLALCSHRYDFFGKNALSVLVLVPLILPPFVGAVGVKEMLGVDGALNALLIRIGWMEAARPYDWLAQGRFFGIVIMNALHLYPILYMNIAASLAHLDPAMEQAAENLGCRPWRRFCRITFPLTLPGVFAGSSIVFIWAFTELGVPLVFDYSRVAPVQIYDGIKDLGGNPMPYALVAIMLAISALVFATSKWFLGRSPLGTAPRPKGRTQTKPLSGWKSLIVSATFLLTFLFASLPHAGVILLSLSDDWYQSIVPEVLTLRHYHEALGHSLVVPSIQNSVWYALIATLLDLLVGLAIAWVIVRSKIRLRGFLDSLVMLPLAVPGLVMAFGYLALSQPGKPFAWLIGDQGNPALLLIVAYAFRRLPYVVRSAVAGLQQSNPVLEEAARSLGASPIRSLRKIAIPLIAANLAAGAILAFSFAMLEVSDSLILAQQSEHYPITKAIYTLLSTLGNGVQLAAALGVWAMVFLSVAIIGAAVIGGKRGGLFKM
jgi:iron(III) transport system permease protein